tara:strand:+ start:1656 stop:2111 length:456 start_codon:yes stop_codon:yes gene_type:complete
MNLEEYLVSKKNIPKQVKKLIEIQNNEFNNILNELIYFNKKISHWAWWVFPTEIMGSHDPIKTCVPKVYKLKYLYIINKFNIISQWIEILNKIIDLIKNKKHIKNKIIPTADHYRIRPYFFDFWLTDDVRISYEKFYDTVNILKNEWNKYT